MTRPPWRPADIADAILMRSTRPTLPASGVHEASMPRGVYEEAMPELQIRPQVDEVYVIIHETSEGVQPVVWPMDTHHPQDPDKRTDH